VSPKTNVGKVLKREIALVGNGMTVVQLKGNHFIVWGSRHIKMSGLMWYVHLFHVHESWKFHTDNL